LHRAIAECDAYYGDWSSLIALFGMTGKPILMQSIKTEACLCIDKLFGVQAKPPDINAGLSYFDYIMFESKNVSYSTNEDGTVDGQKETFRILTTYPDGSSGEHIYEYVKKQISS
jgi:hypothetical protein